MKISKIGLIAILGSVTFVAITGCTSPKDANRALDAAGFTDVTLTGYDIMACSEDDVFHTGFKAKNTKGKFVEGTVCSGFIKNGTIRY